MQLEVVDILERVGVTCVMVTHDQEEAMTMAGRIAIMNRGKLCRLANRKDLQSTRLPLQREFIGSVNVFEGAGEGASGRRSGANSPGLMHPWKVDPDAFGGGQRAGLGGAASGEDHAVR